MANFAGYVQLRRGILEHLILGRINSDEYAAWLVILLQADHRNGYWKGSGVALAAIMHWEPRKAQAALRALEDKGYIQMERVAGKRGNYPITVKRYFKKAATNRTPLNTKQRQIEHPESQKQRQTEHTIQEVTQQKPKPVRIFERDGGKCLCCGTTQKLTLDHITPQAMGGGDEDENLQTLCLSCNDMKGKRISVIIGGVLFLLNSWGLPLKTPMVEIKKLRTQERTQQFRKFPIPIPPKHIVSSPRGIPTLAALIRDEARVRAQANQLIRTASA